MSVFWTPLDSSNLRRVQYDAGSRELLVHFHSGAKHSYEDVPAETFADLCGSESPGRYFTQSIRPHHKSRRVELDDEDVG